MRRSLPYARGHRLPVIESHFPIDYPILWAVSTHRFAIRVIQKTGHHTMCRNISSTSPFHAQLLPHWYRTTRAGAYVSLMETQAE